MKEATLRKPLEAGIQVLTRPADCDAYRLKLAGRDAAQIKLVDLIQVVHRPDDNRTPLAFVHLAYKFRWIEFPPIMH